jgi:hypothetical protein
MQEKPFLIFGIICVIAAIVGGGLKILNAEIEPLDSIPRQLILGAFGFVLIGAHFFNASKKHREEERPLPQENRSIVHEPYDDFSAFRARKFSGSLLIPFLLSVFAGGIFAMLTILGAYNRYADEGIAMMIFGTPLGAAIGWILGRAPKGPVVGLVGWIVGAFLMSHIMVLIGLASW